MDRNYEFPYWERHIMPEKDVVRSTVPKQQLCSKRVRATKHQDRFVWPIGILWNNSTHIPKPLYMYTTIICLNWFRSSFLHRESLQNDSASHARNSTSHWPFMLTMTMWKYLQSTCEKMLTFKILGILNSLQRKEIVC